MALFLCEQVNEFLFLINLFWGVKIILRLIWLLFFCVQKKGVRLSKAYMYINYEEWYTYLLEANKYKTNNSQIFPTWRCGGYFLPCAHHPCCTCGRSKGACRASTSNFNTSHRTNSSLSCCLLCNWSCVAQIVTATTCRCTTTTKVWKCFVLEVYRVRTLKLHPNTINFTSFWNKQWKES